MNRIVVFPSDSDLNLESPQFLSTSRTRGLQIDIANQFSRRFSERAQRRDRTSGKCSVLWNPTRKRGFGFKPRLRVLKLRFSDELITAPLGWRGKCGGDRSAARSTP